MENNKTVITAFYTAFSQLNAAAMNACYAPAAVFSDPVFGILEGPEIAAMWEMLCSNARDFSLTFSNIMLQDEEYATCDWTARYTFSKTGRPVVNKVKAFMRLRDGQITEHTDRFDFWTWSRQALGMPGLLLGWNGFLQQKVHRNARKTLDHFMQSKIQ